MVKSGERIVVGSVVVLLPVFCSPPPETLALLVTLFVPTAVPKPTLTLKLKTLVSDAAIAVELVQVITLLAALQLQFAAFAPPKVTAPFGTVKPLGKVSVTVIAALVAEPPALVTVNE